MSVSVPAFFLWRGAPLQRRPPRSVCVTALLSSLQWGLGQQAWPPPGCLWPGTEVEFALVGRGDNGIPQPAAEGSPTGPAAALPARPPVQGLEDPCSLLPCSAPLPLHPSNALSSLHPACCTVARQETGLPLRRDAFQHTLQWRKGEHG